MRVVMFSCLVLQSFMPWIHAWRAWTPHCCSHSIAALEAWQLSDCNCPPLNYDQVCIWTNITLGYYVFSCQLAALTEIFYSQGLFRCVWSSHSLCAELFSIMAACCLDYDMISLFPEGHSNLSTPGWKSRNRMSSHGAAGDAQWRFREPSSSGLAHDAATVMLGSYFHHVTSGLIWNDALLSLFYFILRAVSKFRENCI
jgi:hypothetical protein